MIIGIGTDLIDIRRIEKTLEKFGDRFIERIYAPSEIEKVKKRAHTANGFAMRYAAKEAASKALGTGFREGVFGATL
ncbi:holo-ACP synthase [Terasakiella sp.]|uniref:holo-ACP synthase n=1 Tax=Terasakiella sp. TaxID=2034861 RepID=UPI003B00B683